jgi:hypothetical protein
MSEPPIERGERAGPYAWDLPRSGALRVPGRVYASEAMLAGLRDDPCLDPVSAVATLPGIVSRSSRTWSTWCARRGWRGWWRTSSRSSW